MTKIAELLQKRSALIGQARAILDKADAENRGLDAPEKEQYDKIDADISHLTFQIDEQRKLDNLQGGSQEPETRAVTPGEHAGGEAPVDPHDTTEYRSAFQTFLRGETRAMSSLTAANGGVLIPTTLYNRIVQYLLDVNVMRGLATIVRVSGPINVPQQTGFGTAYWVADSGAYTESSDTFASPILNLTPKKLTGLVLVPEELIQDSLFDLEAFVTNNLSLRMGAEEENKFIVGAGSATQPKGIVPAITQGTTSASPTALSFDDLIDLEHSVKRVYRRNATFLMGDDSVKLARKVKDSQGRYIWDPATTNGNPDKILGYPVAVSWAMPAYTATTKGPVVFGDLSYYWIAQRCDAIMQRLVELYAGTGQVGYRAFLREDANLTNTAAVSAMTVHA